MSCTDVIRNPFLQQYLLELLLPVVGYYLLDWSIVIICLYYLIDFLATLVMFVRRFFAVNKNAKQSVLSITIVAVIALLTLIYFGVVSISFYFLMAIGKLDFNGLLHEVSEAFFGELWILIPLVFVASIFKDRLTFFVPRRFLMYHPNRFLWGELILNSSFFLLLAVFIGGTLRYSVSTDLLIPLFLIGKIGFDLTLRARIRAWSLNC